MISSWFIFSIPNHIIHVFLSYLQVCNWSLWVFFRRFLHRPNNRWCKAMCTQWHSTTTIIRTLLPQVTLAPQSICMGLIYGLWEWRVSISYIIFTPYIQSAWMCGMLPCVVQSQIFYLIRRVREHVLASLCSHKQSMSWAQIKWSTPNFSLFFFVFF